MVRSLVCREHWFYGSSWKGCLNTTDTWDSSRRRELVSVFLEKVTLKGILKLGVGTYLVIQWLRLCTSNAGSVSLVPNQRTKISHAMWCGPKYFLKIRSNCYLKGGDLGRGAKRRELWGEIMVQAKALSY